MSQFDTAHLGQSSIGALARLAYLFTYLSYTIYTDLGGFVT